MKEMSLSNFCELLNLSSGYFSTDPLFFTKRIKHASKMTVTKPCISYFGAHFELLTENT